MTRAIPGPAERPLGRHLSQEDTMNPRMMVVAALAFAIPAALPARAAEASGSSSAFTLPVADYGSEGADSGSPLAYAAGGASYPYVHYRPRSYGRSRYNSFMPFVTQLHAGFFDPSGSPSSGFLFGLRAGPMVDPHVQLGASVDWEHKSASFE